MKGRWKRLERGALILSLIAFAWPAAAQLGGLGRALPGDLAKAPGALAAPVLGARDAIGRLDPQALVTQRIERLDALVRAHPHEIDRDQHRAPVVRGQVLALAPSPPALDAARRAGFLIERAADPADEIGLVILGAPPGLSTQAAIEYLRKLDPGGIYDFNHLYQPSGERLAQSTAPPRAYPKVRPSTATAIGLIDTGIDVAAPLFAHAEIEQKAFAGLAPKPAAHGTAVASLLVGESPPFRSSAPGARLYAADVYGGAPAGGAADSLVRGLAWLAQRKVAVVNISLVGPPNAALEAMVKALQARGIAVVAAVGNDGPAAPAAYPASYPGVVAVTGVDEHGRILIEAGKAQHLDFAAPGADLAVADLQAGFVSARGTSFAAPLVAGRLATLMTERQLSPTAGADALAAEARPGRAYGRGLVAADLRTAPAAVHARAPRGI